MSPSAREIAQLNIKYYRQKLQTETDPVTLKTIATLLKEEEVKLATMTRSSQQPQGFSDSTQFRQ
jgi:hypothetical protein